eukprot:scaffold222156_cov51-Attheya_sp.AAC.1
MAKKKATGRPEPRIVDHISDGSDEEIDEDEAFNSEDERKYGALFAPKKRTATTVSKDDDDAGSSDDDEEDETSGSSSEEDDNEGIASDDDDDEGDGGQYMLDLLNKLEPASSSNNKTSKAGSQVMNASTRAELKHISTIPESEFSAAAVKSSNLTLDALMKGISNTKGFGSVQKTLKDIALPDSMDRNGKKTGLKTTEAPLARVISERISRKVNYQNQSEEIQLWTETVKQNREAETLDFRPKDRLHLNKDQLVGKFVPTTDFEKEVAKALADAGMDDERKILKEEEQALRAAEDDLGSNKITLEEFKARRAELSKTRALMFYQEQKRHHINKIKSKKYRKIRKKKRDRMAQDETEADLEQNPDLAREIQEEEEMERMKERMTLAHKNTSKWAKRVLRRGGNIDTDTRRALSAQLKTGDDLRKKMMGDESESDADDENEDLMDSARRILMETETENGAASDKKGLFKLSFMQKGLELQRARAKEEARELLRELEANNSDQNSSDDEDQNSNEKPTPIKKKKQKTPSSQQMESLIPKGKLVASALEVGHGAVTSGVIDIGSDATAIASHTATLSLSKVNMEELDNKTSQVEVAKKVTEVRTKSTEEKEEESNPWITEGAASSNKKSQKKKKGGVDKNGIVDVKGAAALLSDPQINGSKPKNKAGSTGVDGKMHDNSSNASAKIASLSQEELVRRAFAAPTDVEAEEDFEKEKQQIREQDDPTRKNKAQQDSEKSVSGWGSWVGEGAPPPRPPGRLSKKLAAPAKKILPKGRKRKDDGKKLVILNEKRMKRTANQFQIAT